MSALQLQRTVQDVVFGPFNSRRFMSNPWPAFQFMSAEKAAGHGSTTDPYRVFFPLGIVLGLTGVSIWPLYYLGLTDGYSGRAHAFVQICGFLYAFAAGFLLTAVPRFTGTESPSLKVQHCLAGLLAVSVSGFEFGLFTVGHAAFLAAHITVITLAARRFVHRRQNPPATFGLVGMGLITGALAAVMNTAIALEVLAPAWDPLARRLLTEGMFLMLVLGVGGFLGPRLLGFAALPKFMTAAAANPKGPALNSAALAYAGAGFLLLLSLLAEYGFEFRPAAFVRALVATGVIAATARPWRLPAVRTTLAWCVWTANLLVVLGVWLVPLAPAYRADFLHVLFIAFTLLVLAVGIRVTLSHGGHALSLERGSWPIRIGLATGLVAMLARLGAPFAPESYFAHLAWAGMFWIAGMLFWGSYVVRLIRKRT
jgi:uncharacterized protein involved in response to NO